MLAAKLLSGMGEEEKLYVDDVFSAYTYTGNGSTQTINNGIDLAGKGGLVWTKGRSQVSNNYLLDSVRNAFKNYLRSDSENGQSVGGLSFISGVSATGYALGNSSELNQGGQSLVSWTFRRAPKFFDVLSYMGDGYDEGQLIPHGLGVEPGIVIVRPFSNYQSWNVYHRSLGATNFVLLNSIDTQNLGAQWYNTTPTASSFTAGTGINGDSTLYIAYLFAHDPSADGLIQCGTYTGNGSATGQIVNLGWEPQYLMIKNASGTGNWQIIDSMRGMPVGSADATLQANLANTESSEDYISPTATGFQITSTSSEVNTSGSNYIYLAIRRPNKPPTTGTEVYNAIARTGTGAAATVTGVGFAPDLAVITGRNVDYPSTWFDRLRGRYGSVISNSTQAELAQVNTLTSFDQDGVSLSNSAYVNESPAPYINHFFRRAPGVFSTLCYTGTGSNKTEVHDLTKAPSLMLVKSRSSANDWNVWCDGLLGTEKLVLNSTAAKVTDATAWNSTAPTSSVISLGTAAGTNANAATYVAYLFSNLAGIQSIGTYIGDDTSGRLINCGFTTGSRYVCIKAISTTGDWLVADSTRGITSGNDPYLTLNSAAAEVTTEDWLDPHLSGFLVNQTPASNANVNGVTYMYWSIA